MIQLSILFLLLASEALADGPVRHATHFRPGEGPIGVIGDEHVGYHGPYRPLPGRPYTQVGCEVLDPSLCNTTTSNCDKPSGIPLPASQTWWHDYSTGTPDHLLDVSKHSIVLVETDLESWIAPGSVLVLPPPSELKTVAKERDAARKEYTRWLEEYHTVDSPAWLAQHPEGLPYLMPDIPSPPFQKWVESLPENLRELAKKTVITFVVDGPWLKPGSLDFPWHRQTPPDDVARQLQEIKEYVEENFTSGYGVYSAVRKFERRCWGEVRSKDGSPQGQGRGNGSVTIDVDPMPSETQSSPKLSSHDIFINWLSKALSDLNGVERLLLALSVGFASVIVSKSSIRLARHVISYVRSPSTDEEERVSSKFDGGESGMIEGLANSEKIRG